MSIPVYNCMIDDIDETTGIYAMSFVDDPANEVDFVALNKRPPVYLNRDEKKQILTGVVLKPEQLIYRNTPKLGEHYIKFSAEEIEKISHRMMKTGLALNSTTHQHDSLLSGNYLSELWIVENPEVDKSRALGFKDLPQGTLMCSYKIEDKSYWDSQVMAGHVKGFSLEGFFNQEINMSKLSKTKRENLNKGRSRLTLIQKLALQVLGVKLSDMESIESGDSTNSGESFRLFTLADGTEVYVDGDGFATLNEEQCPAGEHVLADGKILVIDENGNFVETRDAAGKTVRPEDAQAPQALRHQKLLASIAKSRRIKLSDTAKDAESQSKKSDSESEESLKGRVDDLQAQVDSITTMLEEAQAAIEELKTKTPSSQPATPNSKDVDMSKLSHTDIMAHKLSSSIGRRK